MGATVMKQALIARRKADLKKILWGERKNGVLKNFENFMKKVFSTAC